MHIQNSGIAQSEHVYDEAREQNLDLAWYALYILFLLFCISAPIFVVREFFPMIDSLQVRVLVGATGFIGSIVVISLFVLYGLGEAIDDMRN